MPQRPAIMSNFPDYSQSRNPVARQLGNLQNPRQLFDVVSQPWLPLDLFDDSTGALNNPLDMIGLGGPARYIRGLFGQPSGQPIPSWMNPGAPMAPQAPGWEDPTRGIDGVHPDQQPQGQGALMAYQSPRRLAPGAGNGEVIAERSDNVDNNRALESMAENMLGQSPTQRMDRSSQQAREAMDRSFGKQFR